MATKHELDIERAENEIMVDIREMSRPDEGWGAWMARDNTFGDLMHFAGSGDVGAELDEIDKDLIHCIVLAIAKRPGGRARLRQWMRKQRADWAHWIATRDEKAEVA